MKEPDLVADPPKGFKKLKPINGMKPKPPNINWGFEFENWKTARQLRYLKKLACAMNHAADLLQQERDELNRILFKKEQIIKDIYKKYADQTDLLNAELSTFNKNKQELLERVQNLDRQNAVLRKTIEDLENGSKH
jgi:exonuclease VII small subunit